MASKQDSDSNERHKQKMIDHWYTVYHAPTMNQLGDFINLKQAIEYASETLGDPELTIEEWDKGFLVEVYDYQGVPVL